MIKLFSSTIAILIFWTLPILGQEGAQVNFDVSGSVRSTDGYALPNVRIVFERSGSKSDVRTDINGEFKTTLFHGDYLVSVDGADRKANQQTVLQVGKGLDHVPLNLTVDVADISDTPIEYPKVVTSVLPTYPPAARAVVAEGEVKVEARISAEGKVIEAKAIQGHPLLRATSVDAARRWIFQEIGSEQTAIITFIFLVGDLKKETLLRSDPYRQYVVAPRPVICR